jgi:hypothetical protein
VSLAPAPKAVARSDPPRAGSGESRWWLEGIEVEQSVPERRHPSCSVESEDVRIRPTSWNKRTSYGGAVVPFGAADDRLSCRTTRRWPR